MREPSGGLLVVMSGPSGVGKGTVHARVRELMPDATLSVSVTTRRPRPGERDGVEYRFVDDDTFDRLVADDELLEWTEYAGARYGTPRTPVEAAVASGAVVLVEIEVRGAMQVREQAPDALLVFLSPPSLDELRRRLEGRGTDDEAAIAGRLAVAREELAQRERFDVVIVNDDLDRCVADVVAAIEASRSP